jgi:hypothetical protein
MKRFIKPFAPILLLILLNGCNLDNLDINKLSDEVNLNPTLAAPLATANITGWDLFQSPNKEKGPNGVVNLVYRQNDIIRYNTKDLINFPVQQMFPSLERAVGEISPGILSRSREITLSELIEKLDGGLDGVKPFSGQTVPFPPYAYVGPEVQFDIGSITEFTSLVVSGGTVDIILDNKLKIPVSVTGYLYDTGNNTKIIDFSFTNVAAGTTAKQVVNLAGLNVTNKIDFRMSSFETLGSATPVPIIMEDILKITFDLKGLKISSGNVKIQSQVVDGKEGYLNFTFPEPDMKAFSAILKKGTLKIRTINPSKLTGNVNLLLSEIKKGGSAVLSNIPLNGNTVLVDLAGANVNFASDLSSPFNRIPYSYTIQLDNSAGYINFTSSDVLKMEISLTDFEFQSVYGDFGTRKLQIDPGNFELEVLNRLGGDFKVANPKLSLIMHNSVGMAAEVKMNMSATSKKGNTDSLIRNPASFNIPVPADITSPIVTGTVDYTKQNSNIVEFIALPPNSKIDYSGEINFNKGNVVTLLNPNFITAESTFSADMALELPMELQINTLSFSDTTAISGKDFDKVESAELLINVKNGIPLDMDMQLVFIDTIAKIQLGSSKRTQILSAAKIDASGEYIPVESSHTFILDPNEIESLRKANAVVFSGRVISPLGENQVISILSTSRIELKTVIKSKLNL